MSGTVSIDKSDSKREKVKKGVSQFIYKMTGVPTNYDGAIKSREGKIREALNEVEAQIARLGKFGVRSPALEGMQTSLTDALSPEDFPDPADRYNELGKVKQDAFGMAKVAGQTVDKILQQRATLVETSSVAWTAIKQAEAAIQQMPDQTNYTVALRDLVARFKAYSTVQESTDGKVAIAELGRVRSEAEGLAAGVNDWIPVLKQRAAKLAEIDTELGKLEKDNQKLRQPFLNLVTPKLDELKKRRNDLAQAALGQLKFQLREVMNLPEEIKEAAFQSYICLQVQQDTPVRQMMQVACDIWITAAKGTPQLEEFTKFKNDLQELEELCSTNPNRAQAIFNMKLSKEYDGLKSKYYAAFLGPSLREKLEDPDSAEMKKAVGEDYENRLLDAWNTAVAFGSRLTETLSPAEMVAIYSYTADDYKKINGKLNGSRPPESDVEGKQIDIMIDQLKKALDKLDDQDGIFTRGSGPFPGDERQFTKDNVFTIDAFWSSGIGISFGGKWQMTILGKKGKHVQTLSRSPREAEVLFPPGSKFRVTERDDKEAPKTIYVTLEEV